MKNAEFHKPVLVDQVIAHLAIKSSGIYVDCTLGGGGHSQEILKRLSGSGRLIGIDCDDRAIEFASERLQNEKDRILILKGNFAQLKTLLASVNIKTVDGILLDLGVSSFQIDTSERGFSYMNEGPLDMRMGEGAKITAEHVVNVYPEQELARIFKDYGEERYARSIARKIVQERARRPIATTQQLTDIVGSKLPFQQRIKSFARVFQALRIEVNKELDSLKSLLNQALELLNSAGRLVIISYHSLEDRLVKEFFKNQINPCQCPVELPICVCGKKPTMRLVTRGVVRPSIEEIATNPRSRSAKFRAAEKL
ncbi:16S rRNA (cytosine(1402)-N(4))-methyltransferase RsmH [candidate division KSB1 bacterium]|nr:16S rRNA (cytosine(1402)-N(4))-methyltransferase RsmH [candidate division KSB1 bacterium]